jgi:hypothetical protein
MKDSIFWDTTSCGPFKDNRCFEKTRRFHIQGEIISQVKSSETSADFQQIIGRYIPKTESFLNKFVMPELVYH